MIHDRDIISFVFGFCFAFLTLAYLGRMMIYFERTAEQRYLAKMLGDLQPAEKGGEN